MQKRQAGFVYILYLIVLALGMILLIHNYVYNVSLKQVNSESDKQKYIQDIGKYVSAWYEMRAWEIDSDANAIASADIFTQSTIISSYGLQIQSSNRLEKDGLKYHVIVAWLPSPLVTGTSFDPVTGAFTPGVPNDKMHYTVINGYNIEAKRVYQTSKKVSYVAKLLEQWFEGSKSNSALSDTDTNWFRASNCIAPDQRFLGCADTATPITNILLPHGISDTNGLLNAWGRPIYMTNNTPYEVSITTDAPWGPIASGVAQGN